MSKSDNGEEIDEIRMKHADLLSFVNFIESRRRLLSKAYLELEAHKDASDNKVLWAEVEEHFRTLEAMLKKKSEELEAKEKEYEEKESESRAFLAEREAAVAAKEQDFIDRVQEVKDAAVAAILDASAKYQPPSVDDGDNQDSKVSSSLGDPNSPEEEFANEPGENAQGVDVIPRLELTQLCEQMDAKGLLKFTLLNQKHLNTICEEFSVALEHATEPACLVLDILEGFIPHDETNQPLDNKDVALKGVHKSRIMFLESLAALLARNDPGADHLLNPETKQRAKTLANLWRPKLANAGTDATNEIILEAESYLWLLTTFRIASEFDEEELCKLILVVAHCQQATELCRSLGLSHKVPGIVETLVKTGRQINAVHFIHAFQLSESFPPVPLLKTYLKDLRRNSQGKGGNSQTDVNAQELAALKAVIRCVEAYKLEADYQLDPLQKRVAQLEKSKSDKKRGGDFGKHQQHKHKKQKGNGGYRGFRNAPPSRQAPPPVFPDRSAYGAMPERFPHPVSTPYDYTVHAQPPYAQQADNPRSYYYPPDDRVTPSAYNSAGPTSYGSYMGSGLPSSHPPYM